MKHRFLAFFIAVMLLMTPACAAGRTFSDVASDAWYADAVAYCSKQGLMTAMPDGNFSPNLPATRAMLVMGLYRQTGSPAVNATSRFTDVAPGADYHNAVVWASENGIVSGYTDGRFGPNDEVTREQFAAILWRSAGKPSAGTAEPFADQDQIAGYAADAVTWAKSAGIIQGRGNNIFDPRANITRAEAAVMLHQWGKNTTKAETPAAGAGQSGGSALPVLPTPTPEAPTPEVTETKILITVGDREFAATLADTDAARAFAETLPQTFGMHELNGNEKYAYLDSALPTAARRPDSIHAGDLMLYGSDCVVLFYESFSTSYSYTPLGHIDDPTGLADAVGRGDVTVTFRQAGKETPPAATGNKTLVAYFSATNTTRPLAEYAADIMDADLYEIVPEIPYTEADLKYYTNCRADKEQNDPSARPAISGGVADMSQYDVVFIGYPIWHGQAPRIISTFLESYDFTGKTIVPFCTSHSSGYSDSAIKPLVSGANWLTGRRFAAGTSRSTVESWINSLELPEMEEDNAKGVFDFQGKRNIVT